METVTFVLAAIVPSMLFILAATSGVVNKRIPERLSGYVQAFFGVAWICAVLAFGLVVFKEHYNISIITVGETPVFGFIIDRLSIIILLLVTTVSGIVHLYSIRAMQEERNFRRYFTLLSVITLEVLLVVLANNLLMLSVFWIFKGFTLTFLISHYEDRISSWRAAFKKLRVDILGDLAFLVALGLTWNIFGTFDLQTINNIATQSPQSLPFDRTTIMTALLLVAAMAKSAQFPLHGWLPESVEAPTPVSALMHAGLINAGGYLLIRLSPLFEATPVTMVLAVAVGGFTAIYGTIIMLTRSDVKGTLVYSTMGQMGFMILECGLGVFGLAILHIVAHGLFKANLFLGSGSVIQQKSQNDLIAPQGNHIVHKLSPIRFILASALAAVMLLVIPNLLHLTVGTESILLAFVWITIIYAVPRIAILSPLQLFAGVIAVITVYMIATYYIQQFFSTVIAPIPAISPVIVYCVCSLLVLIGLATVLLQNLRLSKSLSNFQQKLYVRVLFLGYGE